MTQSVKAPIRQVAQYFFWEILTIKFHQFVNVRNYGTCEPSLLPYKVTARSA